MSTRGTTGRGSNCPKPNSTGNPSGRALELFRYLRPYRARFSAAVASLFLSSLLILAFPYLAGSIVDAVLVQTRGGGMVGVDRTALLLLAILAVQAGLQFFHTLSFASVDFRAEALTAEPV